MTQVADPVVNGKIKFETARPIATEVSELTQLGQKLLDEWRAVHGGSVGQVNILTGPNSLAILIEEAFAEAEMVLAAQPEGQALLRRYIEQLMTQVLTRLVTHVEQVTGRQVKSTYVDPDFKLGEMLFLFKVANRTE